jgi:hypothetical protein
MSSGGSQVEEQRCKQRVAVGAGLQLSGHGACSGCGHVQQRSQRPWCRKSVAGAPQEAQRRAELGGKGAHHARLADAGLALQEDDPALPGGGSPQVSGQ